ncbi:DUF2809 domain-containing protein [Aureitalea sp. L0-47]|uniref:ribosomal maturation YjgA family protein n=1 Tax=Aureitalea sp. L0-47 TaxID=2816962 RepID=UPI00223706B6|nr:DUF2809 domain-containing protein [Aureitalea sp. L0-47]MCW5520714.1 DUF2809 domain-containing protein [Aureitalea sp. L0-47]
MKVSFNKRYFTPFLLVLVAEIAIAIFYFHRFVRGFLGDVLVIPLLYYLLRSISSIRQRPALVFVIAFAFLIEVLQLNDLTKLLPTDNSLLQIAMGNTFDWLDLVAYLMGGLAIYFIENSTRK